MLSANGVAVFCTVALVLLLDGAAAKINHCPKTKAPVCGWDSQTYANQCVANFHKIIVRSKGNCPGCRSFTGSCDCANAAYAPVCANGGTFMNACSAQCSGFAPGCYSAGICKYPGAPAKNGKEIPTPMGKANGFRFQGNGFPGAGSNSHNYWQALDLNYKFYESMRSGKLPKGNRIPWRKDSCLKCRGKYGEDLSGGYYEAGGSYLKMSQIIAYTSAMLGWAADVGMPGIAKAGQKQVSLDAILWGVSYLMKGHVAPNVLIAQMGHRCTDFRYFGPPELYEKYVKKVFPLENPKSTRDVAYVDCGANKGSEIAAESAAAMIIAAKVFKANKYRLDVVPSLVAHAKQLYAMAKNCQGSFANAQDKILKRNHASLYGSSGYKDDLAFAAAWMYAYTKSAFYLADARTFYNQVTTEQAKVYQNGYVGYHFDGKFMYPALHVLMARIDPNSGPYLANAATFLNQYTDGGIPKTFRGLAYPFQWGALRVASNAAFLSLLHAKNPKVDANSRAKYFRWGQWTIDYILGDSGRSYLAGYGSGNPKWWWHKFSTFPVTKPQPDHAFDVPMTYKLGPWTQPTFCGVTDGKLYYASEAEVLFRSHTAPHVVPPIGALYGAPLQNDNIVFGRDYSLAEPTIDGNAGLTGALSLLASYYNGPRG